MLWSRHTERESKNVQDQEHPKVASGVWRGAYISLGCLFVVLAGLGAALPVLPTTPFLLVASACFVRSSPALNQRLLRSRLFGPLLRDWQQHRGVRLHVRVTAVTVLLGTVAASILFGELSLPLLILLILLALVGLVVVLRLPLVRDPPQG